MESNLGVMMSRILKFTEITPRIKANSQLIRTTNPIANQTKQVSNQIENVPKPITVSDINSPKINKKIHFSAMNEVEIFDPQDAINLLALLPNKKNVFPNKKNAFPITKKKVVHLDEIQRLNENTVPRINEFNNQLTFLMSKNQKPSLNDIMALKFEFNSLTSDINHYQSLLNNSRYKHHKSKQATLNLLKKNLLEVKSQQNFQSFAALSLRSPQTYIDKGDQEMPLVSLFKR